MAAHKFSEREPWHTLREEAKRILIAEVPKRKDVEALRLKAEALHAFVEDGVSIFNKTLKTELPHMQIVQSALKPDDKDYHAFSFAVSRGRWRMVWVFRLPERCRLVGPFRLGENEGPCLTLETLELESCQAQSQASLLQFVTLAFDPERQFRRKKRRPSA